MKCWIRWSLLYTPFLLVLLNSRPRHASALGRQFSIGCSLIESTRRSDQEEFWVSTRCHIRIMEKSSNRIYILLYIATSIPTSRCKTPEPHNHNQCKNPNSPSDRFPRLKTELFRWTAETTKHELLFREQNVKRETCGEIFLYIYDCYAIDV